MAGELAREDRAHLAHARLHERVAHAAHLRDAARRLDLLRGDPARAQVVEHAAAGMPPQLAPGEQRRDEVGGDRLRLLVDEDRPVRVAVERDAEIRARAPHGLADVVQVLELEGIRLVVRERAVRLEVEARHVERQAREQGLEPRRRHAVAAVDRDAQPRPRLADRQHVLDVGVAHVDALDVSPARRAAAPAGAAREPLDLLQPAGLADRDRVLATQLEAVVLRRVVGGGQHDPAARARAARRRNRASACRRVPRSTTRDAFFGDTGEQRREELRGAAARVAPDRDPRRAAGSDAVARPMRRAAAASSSSGTTPRMS